MNTQQPAPILLPRLWREVRATFMDLLAPPICAACREPTPGGQALCERCQVTLTVRLRPWCERCGAPVTTEGCQRNHRHLRNIAMARAPFRYPGTGGLLVRLAKFQSDRAALAFLAQAMAGCLTDWATGPGRRAVAVPVPLHRRKRRQRGVDQAALLAEVVADRLRLDLVVGALLRRRSTLPQGDVRVTSRDNNVHGAFAVHRPRPLAGRPVVLIDDVSTSGATARECARVLRDAGASEVVLLTAIAP